MPYYMVLFKYEHRNGDFKPPAGVLGETVGETDRGVMGVYYVPDGDFESFILELKSCPTFLECQLLEALP